MINTLKYSLLFILLNLLASNTISQTNTYLINNTVINTSDEIDGKNFHSEAVEEILFDKINRILEKRNKEPFNKNDLLKKVASDQANYMAEIASTSPLQENKEKETLSLRLKYYGGSKHGNEIIDKNSIKKGRILFSYGKVCDDIVLRIFSSSKKSSLFESNKYNLIGIGAKLDKAEKKVYVSFVIGNHKTFNEGVVFKESIQIPYSEKYYGITEADPVFCKRINRMGNLPKLQDGLYVEDNIIYIETDDIKQLKKVIRKKKDGFAVDVLQKEQFTCNNPNIIDYNLINHGVLTKRVYANKLFKSNIADIKEDKNAFKASLGYLPEGIKGNYELNLVIIQNKSACKTIAQNFVINTNGNYARKVELLADTVTINSKFQYNPIADSMVLSFRIPFENKKFSYKTQDIEPFLKLLNEPAFIIYDLKIKAYSSIEGSESENKFLQEERAKSIINALRVRQKENIATDIQTNFNWEDFKRDIQSTKHNILASMNMEEAKKYIREYNLKKELEPIFSNHRYAEIKMKVTYDISGKNEEPYVIKKFDDAVAEEDRPLALSIQKFIINQVVKNRYDISTLKNMYIPLEEDYVGMEMNRIYMLYKYNEIETNDFIAKVENLSNINPNNEYIAFNQMLNSINHSPVNELAVNYNIIQSSLDRLYYTPLRKSTVDGLNVKFQFNLINSSDSVQVIQKLKSQCIEKIKEIVDIKDESIGNSLKLAEIFIENGDYSYARKSLEPWINRTLNEKIIFTYVSLCSGNEWLMHTEKFNFAMQRASEINPKRYCELLNGDNFSLIVFENNTVKENYCKLCDDEEKLVELE